MDTVNIGDKVNKVRPCEHVCSAAFWLRKSLQGAPVMYFEPRGSSPMPLVFELTNQVIYIHCLTCWAKQPLENKISLLGQSSLL